MKNLKIILPPKAEVGNELVMLTKFLVKRLGLDTGYGLGGEYGYGVYYENETFMMHPFCWCEQESCKWCDGDKPNFLFKPNNAGVWWYKWIGRSEERKGELPEDWLDICKKSIKNK